MIFDCNNYTEEEKQELLLFYKEIFEGKEIKLGKETFILQELTDIEINPKEENTNGRNTCKADR